MPRRTDIHKILSIGSGPIVIGQACEFDYSGSQACKALKEEGFEVILVNSNPATIMTDPEMADRTYIEPVTPEFVERIIARERPDALLPTLGGQTGLNAAMELFDSGVLAKYGVHLIGANEKAIRKTEDRSGFKKAMVDIGLDVPRSHLAYNFDEARMYAREIGFPLVVRPSYTLGGTGGGIAWDEEDFTRIAKAGLQASRISEILIEESILGWKEYELEIMRDHADNVVIVCSIENFDPMGVHTGDSITVAPAQTLTDRQYQHMRNAALAIIREIGVDTGGSNIQFAINPQTGRMAVIEMNPRVSRSSALASKATGFPIAKIAAKLAVGYTLDEIANDITRKTPVCFEPTLDYCVVKIPRFAFEKFPETDQTLGTQMKSVGETMAIGRTFRESLHKAVRGLELGKGFRYTLQNDAGKQAILSWLATPQSGRLFALLHALRTDIPVGEICEATRIDLWFVAELKRIVDFENELRTAFGSAGTRQERKELLFEAKRDGFSDQRIAALVGAEDQQQIRSLRKQLHELGIERSSELCYYAVKEAVLPFNKFRGSDVLLGPEMKSTGEVMGIDTTVEAAYLKSQIAAGNPLPRTGAVLLSIRMRNHEGAVTLGTDLERSGFELHATEGTSKRMREAGIRVKRIAKVGEGKPDTVDLIKSGAVSLVINIPESGKGVVDSRSMRAAAVERGIPYITTFEAAGAAVRSMCSGMRAGLTVKSIQEYYA